MTEYPRGSEPPTGITAAASLRWDAQMLQDAMLEAIRTSPDSFIMTEEEAKARPLDYWIDEIRSSTWAVAQQKGQVAGGSELVFSGDTAKVYPPLLIRRLKRCHQARHIGAFGQ